MKIIKLQNIEGFTLIKPVWANKLWAGRSSPIKSHSSMTFGGGYDMSIYDNLATYWFIYIDDKIVGCNSGFKTSTYEYRSRGIWIDEKVRRRGFSKLLFEHLFNQARLENCSFIWSLPRKNALSAYESVGFTKCSDWIDESVEFGPNCYVEKIL